MIFQQILNKDSGLSTRAKLNTMLSALIESDEGVNAAWIFLKSLEQFAQNLSNRESNDFAILEERIAGANDYTDKSINKLYTYVDGMDGGVGGLIDSPSFDPSAFPTDKAITLIALGAGTFTNLHDVTDTPITISQSNSITVFYRAAYVTYWNYKTQVLQAPPMDNIPTSGNSDHVVSSNGIYNFVLAHGFNNDIDITDVTDSSFLAQHLQYALRKNRGTEEDPDYETIASFIIPVTSLIKAGLMPPYINGVFDVNIYLKSPASFASLAAVLEQDTTTIPIAARRSGMTIQFINDDGEYEQWKYNFPYANTAAGNEDFLQIENWRGVDLIPTRDSRNLVESGGVFTFANRVIFVNIWKAIPAQQPFPTAQEGYYFYNSGTKKLYFAEESGEDTFRWVEVAKQPNTIYIDGASYVCYIWESENMKPITKFQCVVEQSSDVAVIAPNRLNKWGKVSSLDVDFAYAEEGFVNEYMLEFTVDSDEFAITLPPGIRWFSEPSWENGNTYQVSVIDNLAVFTGWEAPEENE